MIPNWHQALFQKRDISLCAPSFAIRISRDFWHIATFALFNLANPPNLGSETCELGSIHSLLCRSSLFCNYRFTTAGASSTLQRTVIGKIHERNLEYLRRGQCTPEASELPGKQWWRPLNLDGIG
jgi:hypothetical protein